MHVISTVSQWTKIDDLIISSIYNLKVTDVCYYYLERRPGGFDKSNANHRINNFQKSTSCKGTAEWYYRNQEIKNFTNDLTRFLGEQAFITDAALVPIFTSSPRTAGSFNDRLIKLVSMAAEIDPRFVARDLFHVKERIRKSKDGGPRLPDEIKPFILFDGFGQIIPRTVFLVDDVIASGSHFRVCHDIIKESHPEVEIIGVFLSRHTGSAITPDGAWVASSSSPMQ